MVKSHLLYRLSYRTTRQVSLDETFILQNETKVGKLFNSHVVLRRGQRIEFNRVRFNVCPDHALKHVAIYFESSSALKHVTIYDLNQLSIVESRRIMVWSRSGPVEIKPISTPIEAERNSTYSRAFCGKSSIFVVPSVSLFQPSSAS